MVPALKQWRMKLCYHDQVRNVPQIIQTIVRLQQLLHRLSYWGRVRPDSLMTAHSKALTWLPWFRFLTLSHLTLSCPSDEPTLIVLLKNRAVCLVGRLLESIVSIQNQWVKRICAQKLWQKNSKARHENESLKTAPLWFGYKLGEMPGAFPG